MGRVYGGPRDVSGEMHVTLNRKGEIMIGAAAYEKFGRPEAAVLLYEEENKLIGVLEASTRAKNAYPLMGKKGRDKHRVIRANRFCRHHGIKFPATMAFNNPEIDEEGVLVLDMNDARVVGKKVEK